MRFVHAIAALPARQREVFRALQDWGDWARPVDVGGTNGSHHVKTLSSLVAKGLAESKPSTFGGRAAVMYRSRESIAIAVGDAVVDQPGRSA